MSQQYILNKESFHRNINKTRMCADQSGVTERLQDLFIAAVVEYLLIMWLYFIGPHENSDCREKVNV